MIDQKFIPKNDASLLRKAQALKPVLFHETVRPCRIFRLTENGCPDPDAALPAGSPAIPLKAGEGLCFDFGNHHVGHIKIRFGSTGSHPDAPALIKLRFAERQEELMEDTAGYNGWISKSWIQEETVHVDLIPGTEVLKRRYAFRYVAVSVEAVSKKYDLVIEEVECDSITSAEDGRLPVYAPADPQLREIYRICLRTLRGCMQDVFEDGPKRDRRLWMGDLRLQALANYAAFRNNDLVKRCLYLFAGSRQPDGKLSACVFHEPVPEADDTCMFDYMLLFVPALYEYWKETGDREALEDLYETAQLQIDLAAAFLREDGTVCTERTPHVFIDWVEGLKKEAAALAVLIYCMRYAAALAAETGNLERESLLRKKIEILKQAALRTYYDPERKCFTDDGQAALALQVWMVLAEVISGGEAAALLARREAFERECAMMTPYMHHYYVMALLSCGMREAALAHIRSYWGSMAAAGADTCPEIWVQDDPDASPYKGKAVNSYCHAWSCTPAMLLPAYFPAL